MKMFMKKGWKNFVILSILKNMFPVVRKIVDIPCNISFFNPSCILYPRYAREAYFTFGIKRRTLVSFLFPILKVLFSSFNYTQKGGFDDFFACCKIIFYSFTNIFHWLVIILVIHGNKHIVEQRQYFLKNNIQFYF